MHYPDEPQLIFKYNIAIIKKFERNQVNFNNVNFFVIFNCNYIKYNVIHKK